MACCGYLKLGLQTTDQEDGSAGEKWFFKGLMVPDDKAHKPFAQPKSNKGSNEFILTSF